MITHIRAQKNNTSFRFIMDRNVVNVLSKEGLKHDDLIEIDIIKRIDKKNILGKNNKKK